MYKVRQYSVTHAPFMYGVYKFLHKTLSLLHPLWQRIGYGKIEKPVAFLERHIKGFLFDCKMCGNCILHDTGMSCPMNCPKQLRNGPCGGVRENGNCEVKPEMRCVWVEAWRGQQKLKNNDGIHLVQIPVKFNEQGTSSWLKEVRKEKLGEK